jgi:hypothetical protein
MDRALLFEGGGVAILGFDERDELLPGPALAQPSPELIAVSGCHLRRQIERQLDEIGRSVTLQRRHRLRYFESVADGPA